jgi:hypothetical protein
MFEYECALTGLTEEGGQPDESDGLGDLPVGWTKVRITRRQYNPKWLLIQQVKQGMVEGLLQQFPAELRSVQQYALSIQVEAQFHGLESETPMYLPDVDDVIYISDAGEVMESFNEVREMLGLEPLPEEEDEDFDEDDDDLPEIGDSGEDDDFDEADED